MPWSIVSCEELRPPRDVLLLRYLVQREDGERREVFVEFTGTVAATSPDTLPSPLDEVARTRGRSVIEAGADRIEPVARATVSTTGLDVIPQDGLYEPGDRVYVRDDDHWSPARILHTPANLHAAGELPAIVRSTGHGRASSHRSRGTRSWSCATPMTRSSRTRTSWSARDHPAQLDRLGRSFLAAALDRGGRL